MRKLVYYLQGIIVEFSIFAISESWLKTYNDSLYNIKGYSHECINREDRPGGGVTLYIKNSIHYKLRSDLELRVKDVNILFIEIPKNELSSHANVLVGVCYRPPHVPASDFIEELDILLEKINKEKNIVYFCGDFNFDTLSLASAINNKSNEFHNTFLSYFYNPLIINHPTRINKKTESGTLISNIYTNLAESSRTCQSAILHTDFSDHYSIIAMTDLSVNNGKESKTITKREFTCKNKSKLKKKLNLQNWDYIFNTENLQDTFTYFYNQIRYMFEECFPESLIEITYSNRLPWLTNSIRSSIKQKNYLYAIYHKTPSEENTIKYKAYKNKLTSIMRKSERDYFEDQIEHHNHDLRKSWKTIKDIIGKNASYDNSTISYIINGVSTDDPQTICNGFNNYFVSIAPTLANNIKGSDNPMNYVSVSPHSIFIPYITENEVNNVIISLKTGSAGWDEIPTTIFKPCAELYIKPLTYLINESIAQGVFPDELKIAKVVPIFKSGDKALPSNYRPISVLPYFSKIFEKIMYNHVVNYINSKNISININLDLGNNFQPTMP